MLTMRSDTQRYRSVYIVPYLFVFQFKHDKVPALGWGLGQETSRELAREVKGQISYT